ncbi:copper-binding protein [Sphaerotilus mobilis]|uniref:Copper binding protein CusF n=1 Tax=Sphaerotilus mobilis TaxID=47994 RepID=A0A4Q7LCF3_9BURK|nr:copper-binding protein [Sphaerotilus mobilis]RZS47380.1 copper binding protein CusF [Sphaerotilus mobilis]
MSLSHTLSRRLLAAVLMTGIGGLAMAQTHTGEVVRVDKGQAKVTLKHGPIADLGLPAMAMAYRVSDAQWLDQLKAGDRVRFDVDKVSGLYTITRLTLAR